ncbi:MAG TPA: ATP-binding protein [Sphaerochaeta sp.]|jgi:Mrp family chromosome partitioning ATPase|nr:MAG: ATP-binding protein [Spirochaetae bacterium HGW-Spirochaetae-4]HCG63379.1 ATP-binding protein [Sphaerochaeta sp.]HCJ94865.1 ATP-binding protein [Sphaerochaeta sp.]HCS36487.1 ATP-binding protein [Sphaerochaeta sp.]
MSFKVYGLHIWLFGLRNHTRVDGFPLHFISPVTTFLGRDRRGAMAALDFEKRVAQRTAIREHMDKIGRKILVMSGKGGVGKTTVAVGLAQALAARGERVGLLDTDLHGPNVAKMLQVDLASRFSEGPDGMLVPVEVNGNLSIAGVDSAMEDKEDAIIWRGPMKSMVINDLLARVAWGPLDYLLIDSPPGSGDEQLTVCKSIPELTGAIIVTTAQEVSLLDAVRSVTFCRKMGIAIIGVVENMSSFVCPDCGSTTAIFGSEGGRRIAAKTGTPFLGSVPLVAHRSDGTSDTHALDEALDEIARIVHEGMTCSSVEER